MSTVVESVKLEKYVYDAIRLAGSKAADLTPEQRVRAQSAPNGSELRGKKLGEWILAAAQPEPEPEPRKSTRMEEKYGAVLVERQRIVAAVTPYSTPSTILDHQRMRDATLTVLSGRGQEPDLEVLEQVLATPDDLKAIAHLIDTRWQLGSKRVAESLTAWIKQLS